MPTQMCALISFAVLIYLLFHKGKSSDYIIYTVLPTKSDTDEIFCLQLLSKTFICTFILSLRESRDHLCINPIRRTGLIHKWSIDSRSLITL